MEPNSPKTLDYLALPPNQQPAINVPAVISVACGVSALLFMLSIFVGVWRHLFPAIWGVAGWITSALALAAIIHGAIGALRAPRESRWYGTSLFGYAAGMFVGSLSPIFFLL